MSHHVCSIQCLEWHMVIQELTGLVEWRKPTAGMFMWLKLLAGVRDADEVLPEVTHNLISPRSCKLLCRSPQSPLLLSSPIHLQVFQ